ncbi:MAG: hypothetical protein CVT66_10580 [Actinobacteria bacterium HGW-Actinobacteria-6]|nr:MAG: hypothetical protein CVT66_10580 [Actinobacteria bacterium HGW-Actinobacteria-6]
MGEGALRNVPCWCGSRKKYKNCHMGRADDERVNPWEIEKEHVAGFTRRYCLAPEVWRHDCAPKIVAAHTIPRSGSLLQIARDGRVYSYKGAASFARLNETGGVIEPRLIGVSRASTFYGFCAKHDNSIFAPLENGPFVGSIEQCFLLAYRAQAKENYAKRGELETVGLVAEHADKGKPLGRQLEIQAIARAHAAAAEAAFRDNELIRREYEAALAKSDFSTTRAYVIEFDSTAPLQCSGGIYPEIDFSGKPLLNLLELDSPLGMFTTSLFHGGEGGVLVLSWLDNGEPAPWRFAESIADTSDADLWNAVVRFMFEFFENLCIDPEWWEGLSDEQRVELNHRMTRSAVPWDLRTPTRLTDDGVRTPGPRVLSRYWVGVNDALHPTRDNYRS